jgi:hypothetical protein
MEPEGSIPSSQDLSTCPYPQADQSSPRHPMQVSLYKTTPTRIGHYNLTEGNAIKRLDEEHKSCKRGQLAL